MNMIYSSMVDAGLSLIEQEQFNTQSIASSIRSENASVIITPFGAGIFSKKASLNSFLFIQVGFLVDSLNLLKSPRTANAGGFISSPSTTLQS